jgi:hypothetical protein
MRTWKVRDATEDRRLLDQVLVLKPDHPQALYRRGTVADLLRYLRDQGLESPYSLSALNKLRLAAPERLSEAVDCATARGIRIESKYKLARFLAETDAGLPRAIQFMSDYLADESSSDRKTTATFFLQSYLIRARRWREVVDQYEAKAVAVGEASSWAEPFNVAMAHWAQSRTAPNDFSGEILLGLGLGLNAERVVLGENDLVVNEVEGQCWLLWWFGDNQNALRLLGELIERTEELIKDRSMHWSQWSFWRYHGVQLSQYLHDLQQLRRMIQGEPIRPPILGDSAEAR